jgi:hypothetical protein
MHCPVEFFNGYSEAFEGFDDALVRKYLVFMNQPRRADNISMKYNGEFAIGWLGQAKNPELFF